MITTMMAPQFLEADFFTILYLYFSRIVYLMKYGITYIGLCVDN